MYVCIENGSYPWKVQSKFITFVVQNNTMYNSTTNHYVQWKEWILSVSVSLPWDRIVTSLWLHNSFVEIFIEDRLDR